MRFNERIKKQRQKLRYTQRELADKVNVSPQVISNWERGYTEPSAEDINKLSEILQTSTDYLLGRTNEPSSYLENFIKINDNHDVGKQLELFQNELKTSENLTFNGVPLTEEDRIALLETMQFGIRLIEKQKKKQVKDESEEI